MFNNLERFIGSGITKSMLYQPAERRRPASDDNRGQLVGCAGDVDQ
jgi:hypothetical protein